MKMVVFPDVRMGADTGRDGRKVKSTAGSNGVNLAPGAGQKFPRGLVGNRTMGCGEPDAGSPGVAPPSTIPGKRGFFPTTKIISKYLLTNPSGRPTFLVMAAINSNQARRAAAKEATMADPITRIANQAMNAFADQAARSGMLPLSEAALDAAVETLRAELKALLTDEDVKASVLAGNGTVSSLAFQAMVGAALVAAQAA